MPTSLPIYSGSAYHYTSSVGLMGIIGSRSLWASAASSLNDLAEVQQGWNLIQTILAKYPTSAVVEMLRTLARQQLKEQHEVFILSASRSRDDVNQWRLYGGAGYGYAVELDASAPLAVVSDVTIPPVRGTGSRFSIAHLARDMVDVSPWYPVLYEEDAVRQVLDEVLASADVELSRIEGDATQTEADRAEQYDSLQDEAYGALATIAHLVKNPSFSGEHEVRVVVTFVWGQGDILFRPGADGIIPYARLTESIAGSTRRILRPAAGVASAASSLPVRSVVLGPLLRSSHEATVDSYLRSNASNSIPVTFSSAPLR